jgi:hypothetical protein
MAIQKDANASYHSNDKPTDALSQFGAARVPPLGSAPSRAGSVDESGNPRAGAEAKEFHREWQ